MAALSAPRAGAAGVEPGLDRHLLFTLITGIVLMLPLGLFASEIARDGAALLEWLGEAQKNGIPPPDLLSRVPIVGARATWWWQSRLADPGGTDDLLGSLLAAAGLFGFGATAMTIGDNVIQPASSAAPSASPSSSRSSASSAASRVSA